MIVTASIGIATGDRTTADELLRDADIAMYRAKWDGEARYVVFESGMQDAVQTPAWSSRWTCASALENEEFFLVYQPTFDLETMSPARSRGADPLAPARRAGSVQPDDFIPLLEETGLIVEVGTLGAQRGLRPGRGLAGGRAYRRHRRQRLRASARHRRARDPTSRKRSSRAASTPAR